MCNILKTVIDDKEDFFLENGVCVLFKPNAYGSCTVNLDSDRYVGGIAYWSESNLFEFQFFRCADGVEVFLETKTFIDIDELSAYIENLFINTLCGTEFVTPSQTF